jgi:AcrR family transcriptional regulator
MKGKSRNSSVKAYIAESLLLLMEKKPYAGISISDITRKAGVNRSTYYRNFNSKDDIIKFYFNEGIILSYKGNITDRNTPSKRRFLELFKHYQKHKKELVLIYKHGLSHLFLDVFNSHFITSTETYTDEEICEFYWYTGAIFNSLIFWLSDGMSKSPERMSELYASLMPDC